jgi:hypothetical protein
MTSHFKCKAGLSLANFASTPHERHILIPPFGNVGSVGQASFRLPYRPSVLQEGCLIPNLDHGT